PVESIAILLVGIALLGSQRPLGVLSICLAMLGLTGTVLGIAGEVIGPALYLGLGVGGMERVAEYPGALWRLVVGVAVVVSAARNRRRWTPVAEEPAPSLPVALGSSTPE